MFRFISYVLLATCLTSTIGAGQAPNTALEGERVRVAHRCNSSPDYVLDCGRRHSLRYESGYLLALGGDTVRIMVQSRSAELAIPMTSVDGMWVVDGRQGNFWTGAMIGLVAGGLIGAVVGSRVVGSCNIATPCGPQTAAGFILGMPAGFLLGGLIGSQIQSDRWREVPMDRPRVGLAPRLDQLGLSVSVAF